MEEETFYKEGLSTTLRPKSKSAIKSSDKLESFLTQL